MYREAIAELTRARPIAQGWHFIEAELACAYALALRSCGIRFSQPWRDSSFEERPQGIVGGALAGRSSSITLK